MHMIHNIMILVQLSKSSSRAALPINMMHHKRLSVTDHDYKQQHSDFVLHVDWYGLVNLI